jgi:hypothetical protein
MFTNELARLVGEALGRPNDQLTIDGSQPVVRQRHQLVQPSPYGVPPFLLVGVRPVVRRVGLRWDDPVSRFASHQNASSLDRTG